MRVEGKALKPVRVSRTNDARVWPDYAPPEGVRVTLPEMPPQLTAVAEPGVERGQAE